MRISHHTKDKGDEGLGHIMAKMLSSNIQVALPISEHLPFDLIGITQDGRLWKISVKYRKIFRGKIEIQLRSSWSNSSGAHRIPLEKGEVDIHAIYCPNTKECYFVKDSETNEKTLILRITPTKIKTKVKQASDYTDIHRCFS